MREDLAIITCHYNWCGYKRPDQNLNRFLRQMAAANIPVYGAEASLTGEFVTKGNANWAQIHAREENLCFQKEALLNIAEAIVPKKYTKIAWLDHDILFTNQNWYEETSIALDTLNLVQVFEECHWTDSRGEVERSAKAILSVPCLTEEDIGMPFWAYAPPYHCGFGFAAPRALWSRGIKLYPFNVLGGGDTVHIYAICNSEPTKQSLTVAYQNPDKPIDELFTYYIDWKKDFYNFVDNKYGFVKGSIYHEFHGSKTNRKHGVRDRLLVLYRYNIKAAVLNPKGLIEIKSPTMGLMDSIKQYFIERREDDTDIPTIKGIDVNPAPAPIQTV